MNLVKNAWKATVGFVAIMLAAGFLLLPTMADASPSRSASEGNGSVHIFAFEGSDAILIESNGLFGMVDSGEDDDYPDGTDPRYPFREGTTVGAGHVDEVIAYLKNQGVTPENFVFYVGTHAHSDHIGSADEIIREFEPEYVYTPMYDDSYISDPSRLWDNQYVYDRMLAAAEEVGAQIIQQPTSEQRVFTLGNLELEIMNYREIADGFSVNDANDYCWGVKVSDDVNSMFLAGDINNVLGSEDKLASVLGEVDAIKLGHHGYSGSSTHGFIEALSPKVAVLTGWKSTLADEVSDALFAAKSRLISSDDVAAMGRQAVVLEFTGKEIEPDIAYDPSDLRFRIRNSSPIVTAYRDFTPVKLDGWVRGEGVWYWFDDSSTATESSWVHDGGAWYYLRDDAQMATGWAYVDGYWYYFNGGGAMQTGWVKVGGTWYYLNPSGAMLTGWQWIGGAWYYLDPATGAMATGWVDVDGIWYYTNGSGAMLTGWQRIGGSWYYLNGSGAMATGWASIDGAWYYLDSTSGAMRIGWILDGKTWYYANGGGAMQTGWLKLGGTWYYLNSSGAMATGWARIGGVWYYLDPDSGAMATGWRLVEDGVWYYLNSSGAMLTGWQWIGGAWYYLEPSGAMAVGWTSVSGSWYFLKESGAMATGWVDDGGIWYYTDGSGAMQTGWLKLGGTWYYLNSSGAMATGWARIGGIDYFFEESGAWVEHPSEQKAALDPARPQNEGSDSDGTNEPISA